MCTAPRPSTPAARPLPAPRAPNERRVVRDRLATEGEDRLTDGDLLGLLVGARRADAGAALLQRFGGLRPLARAGALELVRTGGLGPATAGRIAAAFALGRRAAAERLRTGRVLRASAEIFEAFHGRLRDLRKERFLTVLLDARNRVIREDLVSEGILTASLVHPREVFAPAIREAAGALLLVHNHPSGDPEPSPEDLEITRRLAAVGELVGIRVLDHVVIGDGAYVSFLERGLLPP